jgi:hypothetical protein
MKSVNVIALVVLAASGGAARAEATGAQRAACTPDVWRLCASEIPDVGAIKVCLRREKARLSVACRTVIETADKGVQTVAAK